jgi:hypothetical protein
MENFFFGAIGALAPEVLRWRRITRSGDPAEWGSLSYWLATLAYVALAGFMANLIAQPNPYAAFMTGLTAEYAIAGAMTGSSGAGSEELGMESATGFDWFVSTLRQHAGYLTNYD